MVNCRHVKPGLVWEKVKYVCIFVVAPCPRDVLANLAECTITSGCTNPNTTEELACSTENCFGQLIDLFLQSQECLSCVAVSGETPELGVERFVCIIV